MSSVRAQARTAPVEQTEPSGLYLSPQQVAEVRQLLREMRGIIKEVKVNAEKF